MTQEKKQITIYDLLPLLKPGWVAMDKNGHWHWFQNQIERNRKEWDKNTSFYKSLSIIFDIAPIKKWKDSLMECGK
ncbi:MAG: hypothetical protein NC548_44470 [Lachnospiraceae bacterium]|nr:hypothetical protein [Lachnospiraceae bacterium]